VHLDVEIQAPTWAPYDEIEVYVNAVTSVAPGHTAIPPTRYTATPTRALQAGVDFTVEEIDPYAADPIPGARRNQTVQRISFEDLTEDSWIVVVVKGSEAALPMFPVYPRDLDSSRNVDPATGVPDVTKLRALTADERGVRALGFTNALWVDVDGDGAIASIP